MNINIEVDDRKISSVGINYQDSIASQIDEKIILSYIGAFNKPILYRLEVDNKINGFGDYILYYFKVPNEQSQMFIGEPEDKTIKKYDNYFYQSATVCISLINNSETLI